MDLGPEIIMAPSKWSAVILGEACSKANSRRLVRCRGKTISIKSEKALQFVASALWQLARHRAPIEGEVSITMHIYYCTQRSDLDESLVLDILQGYAYRNDRQVRERHVYHHIDKNNPRVEIIVEPRNETKNYAGKVEGASEAV